MHIRRRAHEARVVGAQLASGWPVVSARTWISSSAGLRLRRWGIRLALAVALLLVLYPVVTAVLLGGADGGGGGRLARLLSQHPESFRVEYASARSFWPGRVHVEGLDLRVRDDALEWQLHIDRADASISLLALLAHRFHTSRIEAQGVTYRMRLRREEANLTADKLACLPPIEGFGKPLVGVPLLPQSSGGRPFTLALEGIDLHGVREVWLDTYRVTGDLAVRGAFTIVPQDHFEVSPTHVDVRDAVLTTGGDALVTGVQGPVDARIDPVPQAETDAPGVLRRLSSRSSLEGRVAGVAFLRHYLPPTLVASGGEGTFRGVAVVERGVVTDATTSHIELGPVTVAFEDGHRVSARSTLDTSTSSQDSGFTGHLAVALADVTLTEDRPGAPQKTMATAESMALSARIEGTDLAVVPRDFAYAWDALATKIEDLRIVDAALGHEKDFRIEWGSAKVSTTGSGTIHGFEARATVDSGCGMLIEGAHASTRSIARLVAKVDFGGARTIDLTGSTVELLGLAVRGSTPKDGWSGHVRLDRAVIHTTPPSVELNLSSTARDGRPALALYAAMDDVSPATRAAIGIVPDPAIEAATAGMTGACRLRVTPGVVALRGLDVKGASSRVRGDLVRREGVNTGKFLFEAGPVSMGLALETTGTRVVPVNATEWFEQTDARQ